MVNEKAEEGQVLAHAVLEVVGKPKEHIHKAIKDHVENIKQDKEIEVEDSHIEEPTEQEDMYSTFAEVKAWFKDMSKVINFCFDYMPSSIEILEPDKKTINMNVMTDLLTDLQGRLHHVDMLAKKLHQDNQTYNKSLTNIIRNFIKYMLTKPRTIEDMEKLSGVKQDKLKQYADKLVEEGKIKEEKGKYYLK
ncbi:MAG: hypothetical protein ACQEP1_01600 [Nanobdellota archaeon]